MQIQMVLKKNRAEFEDLMYHIIRQPGASTEETNYPSGIALGTGVRLAANQKIFTDGSPIQTDNNLDISIAGRGFLQVEVPGQTDSVYTRSGSMQVDERGRITMHNGYVIQPEMTIPEGTQKVNISKDGIVSVVSAEGNTEELGRIELTDFINPAGLIPTGENLYRESIASGKPVQGMAMIDGFGQINQGTLEASNVNVVEEMVNLIEAQRSFEVASKAVSKIDAMLQNVQSEI
jgi:flagellar basal-body rod protein FlgG